MIFSVRRPQYFISHTKSQRLLVTRHRLSCEKVNLHNTLVTWAWDACDISEQQDSGRKNTAKPFVTTMFKKIFRPAKLHLPLNRSFWKRTEHRKVKWMITTKPSSNNPVTFNLFADLFFLPCCWRETLALKCTDHSLYSTCAELYFINVLYTVPTTPLDNFDVLENNSAGAWRSWILLLRVL